MSVPQIRLKTEGFRAINKANIIIDGITVVAGENSSGKSTLSKLLYYLFKTASNYEALVYDELLDKLRNVYRFLDTALHEVSSFTGDRALRDELYNELRYLRKKNFLLENSDEPQAERWQVVQERWLAVIRRFSDVFNQYSEAKDKDRMTARIKRLKLIAADLLESGNIEISESEFLPFDKIGKFVEYRFKEAKGKTKSRPNTLFIEALKNVFSGGELPKIFEVYEFEDPIVSLVNDHLKPPYSIANSIYIDTPMIIGVESSEIEYWDDLNELLNKRGKSFFSEISQTISNEIIHGDVSVNDVNSLAVDNFSFKRADGSIFNLLDCATGVKSFAILQLLLKNGSLNDKTLLIIDEPESHLHPQWIIEYARLIVLLNKHAGIKFFIASHNPDMVSAIKYISAKEGVEDKLHFYLAAKIGDSYLYDYEHLGTEIDPIFGSFNIAIDRIKLYGV